MHCIHDQNPKIHQQMLQMYKSHFIFQAAIKCSVPITKKSFSQSSSGKQRKKKKKRRGCCIKQRQSFAYRALSCFSSGFLLLRRFRGLVLFGFFCRKIKNEGDSSSNTRPLSPVNLTKKALTLLCRSRDAVLLGSGFGFGWLLWHLCDRGLLGNVVLHWFLQFGLEKVTRTRLTWMRLERMLSATLTE